MSTIADMKVKPAVAREWGRIRRAARPEVVRNTWQSVTDNSIAILKWSSTPETRDNWGDALNPRLISGLTGRRVLPSSQVINVRGRPVFAVIGSILDNAWERRLVVWGAGFKHADATLIRRPQAVFAVRGPLTRRRLVQLGIDCPSVYGDPALLYPRLYQPVRRVRYRLGIIPHYADVNHPALRAFRDRDDVLMIDVRGGVDHVVDRINECSVIAASSLHGIIAAEAYGVPAVWIRLSDNIAGWPFKYLDYYQSTHRSIEAVALDAQGTTSVESLIARAQEPDLSRLDLDALMDACPLRPDTREV